MINNNFSPTFITSIEKEIAEKVVKKSKKPQLQDNIYKMYIKLCKAGGINPKSLSELAKI